MRYAIYYTPPAGSALHALGSRWLGRDVFGMPVAEPVTSAEPFIADARRYGFHATLKAPFALRAGTTVEGLLAMTAALARKIPAVLLHELEISDMHGFLALRPREQDHDLAELERNCLCHLDQFRANPSAEELARRNISALSVRQKKHLSDWGYPFVLDAFRFHMTLSCQLEGAELAAVHDMAARHFAPVTGRRHLIDSIAVFHEEAPGAPFTVLEEFSLNRAQAA
ncbi:MAG: DUF1045 domain-containing protein [Alphaproteobacteria bacterium]|nr:DUF1045 domain-containing protein [Alphaproteobacteria bacterium]